MQKMIAKNKKGIATYFASLFSRFALLFSFFHFAAFRPRVGIRLFFRRINETRHSHKTQNVYSECFIFHGVFCENISKIPPKCEIRKVYGRPDGVALIYSRGSQTFWYHAPSSFNESTPHPPPLYTIKFIV